MVVRLVFPSSIGEKRLTTPSYFPYFLDVFPALYPKNGTGLVDQIFISFVFLLRIVGYTIFNHPKIPEIKPRQLRERPCLPSRVVTMVALRPKFKIRSVYSTIGTVTISSLGSKHGELSTIPVVESSEFSTHDDIVGRFSKANEEGIVLRERNCSTCSKLAFDGFFSGNLRHYTIPINGVSWCVAPPCPRHVASRQTPFDF